MPLNGRTALVTGASRGIGRAIAERLAADGAHVAVHYASNDAAADDTVAGKPELVAGTVSVTALGRIGRPVDIADAVAFLAADDARWITGNWVDASGGLHLGPGGFRPS